MSDNPLVPTQGNLPTLPAQSKLSALLGKDANLGKAIAEQASRMQEMIPEGNLPPFKRIKMPRQGMTDFEFVAPNNQIHRIPHMVVHVIHIQKFRILWQNNRALCQSDDSNVSRPAGTLFPNQNCSSCPKSQFRPKQGGGQDRPECTLRARIFFIPCALDNPNDSSSKYTYPVSPDGAVHEMGKEPMYLDIPPTSLKTLNEYFGFCSGYKGLSLPYQGFITLMKCQNAQNASGQVYAKLVMQPIDEVEFYQYKYGEHLTESHKLKESKFDVHEDDAAQHVQQQTAPISTGPVVFTPPAGAVGVQSQQTQQPPVQQAPVQFVQQQTPPSQPAPQPAQQTTAPSQAQPVGSTPPWLMGGK